LIHGRHGGPALPPEPRPAEVVLALRWKTLPGS
jgi:hypothetical protein